MHPCYVLVAYYVSSCDKFWKHIYTSIRMFWFFLDTFEYFCIFLKLNLIYDIDIFSWALNISFGFGISQSLEFWKLGDIFCGLKPYQVFTSFN
jgi:hypothetical protein